MATSATTVYDAELDPDLDGELAIDVGVPPPAAAGHAPPLRSGPSLAPVSEAHWDEADPIWADDRASSPPAPPAPPPPASAPPPPVGPTIGLPARPQAPIDPDETAVLERDALDLTLPTVRPGDLDDGEPGHDPPPPVDRL
jgi:hypothetical protein